MHSDDIYIEVGFEQWLSNIYGRVGSPVRAGFASLKLLKKTISKVFRTLSAASGRSIHGDSRHREKIVETCDQAIERIQGAKGKDEVMQLALIHSLHLNFALLGHNPDNWRKQRADWRSTQTLPSASPSSWPFKRKP